jgi:hypothetical protein
VSLGANIMNNGAITSRTARSGATYGVPQGWSGAPLETGLRLPVLDRDQGSGIRVCPTSQGGSFRLRSSGGAGSPFFVRCVNRGRRCRGLVPTTDC